MNRSKWAIIGLGFISQRHIQAIREIKDEISVVCDIDIKKEEKLPNVPFFKHWKEMMDSDIFKEVDWVAICTPNYLHFDMIVESRKRKKKVLCEKPLVIDLEHLKRLERMKDVYSILQLRRNPELRLARSMTDEGQYECEMKIKLHRGDFYFDGWKADEMKSGGLIYNIGIHYFDLLQWFFGKPIVPPLTLRKDPRNATGIINFINAKVKWELSISAPMDNQIRQLKIGKTYLDLSQNFEGLHTKVYKDAKAGFGITPKEAGKAIKLIENMKYE